MRFDERHLSHLRSKKKTVSYFLEGFGLRQFDSFNLMMSNAGYHIETLLFYKGFGVEINS